MTPSGHLSALWNVRKRSLAGSRSLAVVWASVLDELSKLPRRRSSVLPTTAGVVDRAVKGKGGMACFGPTHSKRRHYGCPRSEIATARVRYLGEPIAGAEEPYMAQLRSLLVAVTVLPPAARAVLYTVGLRAVPHSLYGAPSGELKPMHASGQIVK